MPKPKLLFLTGFGWAATNPLFRTLRENAKVIFPGYCKEPDTLPWIYEQDKNPEFFDRVLTAKFERLCDKDPRFLSTGPERIFSRNTTLSDFIDYYTRLYSNKDRGSRQYVCDFSNRNAFLPPEFISEIAPALNDNFDVKVMMIARNPVRRSYSFTSAMYRTRPIENSGIGKLWDNKDPESRKKWQEETKNFPDSISYWKDLLQKDYFNLARFSYIEVYKKWAAHFHMLPIVMEDLWSGNVEPLENFLECKIGAENLYPNCYYPERGTKAEPRIKQLKDQWMSDMQDLTEEDLAFGKQHLQYVYDEWYDEFKTRPWES